MTQAVHYRTEWMGGGAIQASKAVTVRNIADTSNATVYTSTAGTTTGSNPINTDSNGLFETYLLPGRYLLKDATGDKLEITVGTPGADTPAPATPPAVTGARGGTTITSPTDPGSSYVQAEAAAAKTAIDALIAANVAQAATLTNLLAALATAGVITNSTTT